MWIDKIELPEELTNAQADGKLVIFAGAGISMSSPSDLPSFEQLVKEIQSETGNILIWNPEKEAPDRFLGRLDGKGSRVHKLVWDRIKNQDSKPTELHRALLSLFRSPQEVRIVTTNFDTHFTTAATELFDGKVPIYRAPALPLGHRFNGIVYLHGCVDQEPEELILTDGDFGRAYLTEGWATRFLIGIFSNYKVLFVGYSHNDLTMEYLEHGLPPGTKRFALIPEDEREKWSYRGIELITYPHNQGGQNHNALVRAVKSWADQTRMELTEHEQRIRDMVQFSPPLDKDQAGYIEEAIKDPVKVRIFTRYAETVEWLQWAEGKGVFKPLFSLGNPSDEISRAFAEWFAEKYVSCHPEDALAVVQRQGQVLSPMLWQTIALQLYRSEPLPQPEILAKWVAVLITTSNHSSIQGDLLNPILRECCRIEYATTAILIFKYLSTPYLVLKPSFAERGQDDKQVTFEVVIQANYDVFNEMWNNFFKPNLRAFAHELEPIITGQLKHAYRLLCSVGCANDKWDPVSFERDAIEPHEQNRSRHSLSLLIDAARDIIEFLLKDDSKQAQIVVQEWASSNTPILKRLAIYGMTIDSNCGSNEKLKWLLANNWLFAHGLKHEVFQLLKAAYPQADETVRRYLLQNVDDYLKNYGTNEKDPAAVKIQSYKVYNLLYWLVQVAPHCSLAHHEFNEIQAKHPEFQPREYPDLDWYMSVEWGGNQSPITVDELISKPISEMIEFLLTYQGDFLGPDRTGLLLTVKEAVVRSFAWSWELIKELEAREEWSTDLWGTIISGWQTTDLTETQWEQVLQFLEQRREIWRYQYKMITELLEKAVKASEMSLPISLLSHAEAVTDRLWQEVENYDEKEMEDNPNDWLTIAINHVGGIITQFWLLALSRQQNEKENWPGILDKYKTRFDRVISGKSSAAAMGRVILASQLHFLFSLDRDWTLKKIVPLLNWDIDANRAEQAWEGYLWWGRWNEALLSDLLPLYEQAYDKLSKESEAYDRLCAHLASIAVRSSIDPIQNGWLDKFIDTVDENARIRWATEVNYQLTSLAPEVIKGIWDKWIKNYWSKRLDGIHLPLSKAEAGAMAEWALALQPVFPEVVDLIITGPIPVLQFSSIYYELAEKNFAEKYPWDTAKLLVYLLEGESCPFYHYSELKKLFNDISKSLPSDKIKPLKNELIRLGCFPWN